jgi:arylsulfatase A-like enzyme
LRGFKGGLYEGGSRVPLIARWPGHIPAGKTSGELVGLVDLLATSAAIVGVAMPADAGPDSFNILPALLNEKPAAPCRDHLVMQSGNPNNLAIRQGPWKLIPESRGPKGAILEAQLFDLADDLAETRNLASQNPEEVKELSARLDQIRTAGRSRQIKPD